jgi:transposase-like protein
MNDAELYAGGSGTKLFDFKRGYMKTLYDSEVPVKNIAQRMRIGLSTVHDTINKKIW